MKKVISLIFISLLFSNCSSSQSEIRLSTNKNMSEYANSITADELKEMLYIYASDEFEGRQTGEPGQKKAVEFIKNKYESLNIESPISKGDYFQEIPASYFVKFGIKNSENVLAYIKGSEKPDEVVIISSHLD